MIEINPRHLEKLLTESVRYCLGRMTYAVRECNEIVRQYWQYLSKRAKEVIRRDIAEEIKRHDDMLDQEHYTQQLEDGYSRILGHECDAFTWIELLNWIDEQEAQNATTN